MWEDEEGGRVRFAGFIDCSSEDCEALREKRDWARLERAGKGWIRTKFEKIL